MRSISVLLFGATLASCSTAPQPAGYSLSAQQHLQQLTSGKAAGGPVSCVPAYNSNDMSVIDGRTLAFRASSRTTYVAHLSQGCSLLGSGGYALLTRQFGGSGLCRGDIAQVVNLSNQLTVGSCSIQEIVPYTSPG